MKQFDVIPGLPDALQNTPPKARKYEGMTLDEAIARSHALVDEACERWPAERILLLLSGGSDSTLLAHLMRRRADTIVHIDTTIGVEATHQYVRDIVAAWSKPYIEVTPPDSYRDLVLGRALIRSGPNAGQPAWKGFPGPAAHYFMYQRLKERALAKVRRSIVGPRGKPGQIVYLAGMRWSESDRRFRNAEEIDPDGAVIWVSPIVHWTDGHIREYRERHYCSLDHQHAKHKLCSPEALPFNEVTAHIHHSGDCECGAYAKEGEIYELELFYPELAELIHEIEEEAQADGDIPEERCAWGWGANRQERPSGVGRLCSSCALAPMDGQTELFKEAS
jgi:3'-phosphoadenosine 5'-phosphosulfate sulfotransferase (PAPS reductase)/FAD synthetase